MPPMLKPLVTTPKVRRMAPGGAAARTSMSREGMINPPSSPASAIAMSSGTVLNPARPMASTIAALRTKPTAATSPCRRGMCAGKPPPGTPKAPATRNTGSARGARRSRVRNPPGQGGGGKGADAARRQAQQGKEPGQADDGGGQDLGETLFLMPLRRMALRDAALFDGVVVEIVRGDQRHHRDEAERPGRDDRDAEPGK